MWKEFRGLASGDLVMNNKPAFFRRRRSSDAVFGIKCTEEQGLRWWWEVYHGYECGMQLDPKINFVVHTLTPYKHKCLWQVVDLDWTAWSRSIESVHTLCLTVWNEWQHLVVDWCPNLLLVMHHGDPPHSLHFLPEEGLECHVPFFNVRVVWLMNGMIQMLVVPAMGIGLQAPSSLLGLMTTRFCCIKCSIVVFILASRGFRYFSRAEKLLPVTYGIRQGPIVVC